MKSYTDIKQSKKLAEFLPLESADMRWQYIEEDNGQLQWFCFPKDFSINQHNTVSAWSLAALLNILHFRQNDITSLSGGGYKDGNYISDWCLDYEYDDGDYQKTFGSNPVDACYEMIIHLHELNLL